MNLNSDRMDRITTNAVARARVVQTEINFLRAQLSTKAPRPFRDKSDSYEDFPNAAVLASYDSEMAYLMKIPGVAQAFFDEVAP